MLGVKLSYHSKKEFEANPNEFKLVVADIIDVHVKVKKMNTISLAEGNALAIQVLTYTLILRDIQSPISKFHLPIFHVIRDFVYPNVFFKCDSASSPHYFKFLFR